MSNITVKYKNFPIFKNEIQHSTKHSKSLHISKTITTFQRKQNMFVKHHATPARSSGVTRSKSPGSQQQCHNDHGLRIPNTNTATYINQKTDQKPHAPGQRLWSIKAEK